MFEGIPTSKPPDRGMKHVIELEEGAKQVIITPYKHWKKYKDEIEKAIKKILEMGHIKPSKSPFTSAVVLVKRRDGTSRMCIDYSELNKRTNKSKYLTPRLDELINELHGAYYFSKIDLRYSYHKI